MIEKFKLVGYWNCNLETPEITFNPPESELDSRKLVIINLEIVPDVTEDAICGNVRKLAAEGRRINRGLRSLLDSTRRLK